MMSVTQSPTTPMSKLEEARKVLEQLGYEEWRGYEEVMRRADAYALAAHVAACGLISGSVNRDDVKVCGDGWHCPKAKEIQEQGK